MRIKNVLTHRKKQNIELGKTLEVDESTVSVPE